MIVSANEWKSKIRRTNYFGKFKGKDFDLSF